MNNRTNITRGASIVYLAALVLSPVFITWQGYVLEHLWNWFAPAPLARVSFLAAVGMMLLFHVIAMRSRRPISPGQGETTEAAIGMVFAPQLGAGLALFFGWAVHVLQASGLL